MKIKNISAREVLDSRGNPTVAATVELEKGVIAEASVPSGASTGANEAFELRDANPERYAGQGTLKAVQNIESVIAPAIMSISADDQAAIDEKMIALDGTPHKSHLGANAMLAVSLAVARAAAIYSELELFEYLAKIFGGGKEYRLPTPMFNVLNGGRHAENQVDIQETMIVPVGLPGFARKLEAGAEIYHVLKNYLVSKGFEVGLGDEGGFAPALKSNEEAITSVGDAIKESKYPHSQVRISLDIAASELWDEHSGMYQLAGQKPLGTAQVVALLSGWSKKYNLFSVEDGLAENDLGWKNLTKKLGPTITIGDDLFTTDAEKIELGAKEKLAGGVIIKPNQIGTLTETFKAIKAAQDGKMKVVISHRSGETEDSFIADLAVAVGADFVKAGAPARSERLAKYNRLTKIESIIHSDK